LQSCKKTDSLITELATSQNNGVGKSEIPITIQEAKDYVEKLKATQLSTANNFSETGSPCFSLNFNWNNYINENSFRGKNYLVVPIEESQYSWGNKGRVDVYGAFRRDSVGHITGNFYVYVVDSLYFNRVNKKPDSRNFTGELLLYDLQSNFLKGVKLVNGVPEKVINGFTIIDANRGNGVTLRTCTTKNVELWWVDGDGCMCFNYRAFSYTVCNWEENETWTGLVTVTGNPTIGYPAEGQESPPNTLPLQYTTVINDLLLIMTGDANYDYFRLRWGMHLSDADIDKLNNLSISLNLSAAQTALLSQTHILSRLSDWLANNSSNGYSANAVFLIHQYFSLLVDPNKSWATMTALENIQISRFSASTISAVVKYFNAGFTGTEFSKLLNHEKLFKSSNDVLNNNGLSQSEKNQFLNELHEYINSDDFQESLDANVASNLGINNPIDPLLDLSALEQNQDFRTLTTARLRALVNNANPDIEDWKRNISAGRALEEAYAKFVSAGVVTESNFRKGFKYPIPLNNGKTRWIIPDFLHPTNFTNLGSNQYIDFPYGGVVEVKAAQNPITLQTSSSQIEAEIQWASTAYEFCFINCARKAGIYNSGSYTLVMPYGGTYSQDIVDECTRKGVNFYVSYAFIEANSNKVVFSNPERKNNISQGFPHNAPVNINKRIPLDISGSIQRWQKSNNQWDE
jgi:hypothetical protein